MATVLVVDDEPDIRALIQLNLELDGHDVVTAANGAEALAIVGTARPDVMLLDLMMPEIDGFAVLESIKATADPGVSRIPILMLTADDTPESRIRGGIEGAIRYLRKPFSPEGLRREVREALAGEPEPAKRRRVQRAALEQLARLETGNRAPSSPEPRPKLTRLEHRAAPSPPRPSPVAAARDRLPDLTWKQRQLLDCLAASSSVSAAAGELGVSRSNIYASLRRISRKLAVPSVPELLALVRDGSLLGTPGR